MILAFPLMAVALAESASDSTSAKEAAVAAEAAATAVAGPARPIVEGSPASEILAANRLVIPLWQDVQIKAIYTPYFDCYWAKAKPTLAHQLLTHETFEKADGSCSSLQADADGKANRYLRNLAKYASPAIREGTITRYRQQVGMITLIQHFHNAGEDDVINQYLTAISEPDRNVTNAPHP